MHFWNIYFFSLSDKFSPLVADYSNQQKAGKVRIGVVFNTSVKGPNGNCPTLYGVCITLTLSWPFLHNQVIIELVMWGAAAYIESFFPF